jgi:uncharacterized integral membrane protein
MAPKIKYSKEELIAQLHELNDRSRMYNSQIWQVPFAYFGLTILVITTIMNNTNTYTFVFSLIFELSLGVAVIIHMLGLQDGINRAVSNVKKVESKMGLENTVKYSKQTWWPLFIMVIIITSYFIFISVSFITSFNN